MNLRFAPLAILLCVFVTRWAAAEEANAAKPSGNAQENAARVEPQPSDPFYLSNEVQTVHLEIAEEDWNRLIAALPKMIQVPVKFRWRDQTIEKAAVRFKGNSSRNPQQKHKRSFLIKFDEYEKDRQFLGMRRVAFDNAVQFGGLFSEPIITETLHDLGIPCHRANYAKLYLNGKFHGVYANVERIDESFIERRLGDRHGKLYKVDEGGAAANLQFIGDDPADYEHAFEASNKRAKKGRAELIDFICFINSPHDSWAEQLAARFEIDDFLDTMAVMLFSGAFDQLTGWNPHNYYLFYDGDRGRWRYFPWDLDVGFCETAFGQIKVLKDWNAAWPTAGQLPNPLIDRIVAEPALLARYRERATAILEKYFEPSLLEKNFDAKYALIKDELKEDPFPVRRITNMGDQSYDDVLKSMKTFVKRRYESAQEQLKNPGERPPPSAPPFGPPPQLVVKVQRVMRAAQAKQKKGEDVRPIQQVMEQVGPLLQRQKFKEAEKLVDQALELIGEQLPKP